MPDVSKRSYERFTRDGPAASAADPEELFRQRDRHLRYATKVDPEEALGEALLPLLRGDDLVAAGSELVLMVAFNPVNFPILEAPEDRLERLELRARDVCVDVACPYG